MYTHISRPETEEGTECSEHTDTRSTALRKEKTASSGLKGWKLQVEMNMGNMGKP